MTLLRPLTQIDCVSIFWLTVIPLTWFGSVTYLFAYLQTLTDATIALGIAEFAAIPITGGVVFLELAVLRWWRTARNKRYELPL